MKECDRSPESIRTTRNDLKKVIKELQEMPFIIGKDHIETDSYIIILKSKLRTDNRGE